MILFCLNVQCWLNLLESAGQQREQTYSFILWLTWILCLCVYETIYLKQEITMNIGKYAGSPNLILLLQVQQSYLICVNHRHVGPIHKMHFFIFFMFA